MASMPDVLVIGSGASAVHAATPLVEAGFRVRMLDVGHRDVTYDGTIPVAPFTELRQTDRRQHRYFLGERFEGIGDEGNRAGPQVTPPRQYIFRGAEERLPVESATFAPLQSLARGGLAGTWGAGCPPFDDADLAGTGLTRADLQPHYEALAARIGVSGASDDLAPFLGDLRALQPPSEIDLGAHAILGRYAGSRTSLNRAGLFMGRPRLALLTRDLAGRKAHSYLDMDFWSDEGRSVYRPAWTLDALTARPNFEYCDDQFVEHFTERGDHGVAVTTSSHRSGRHERHQARAMVLAAGTLGTARIVLRSLGRTGQRIPLVCNPHAYAPLINLPMIGTAPPPRRHSLAQICFIHVPKDGVEHVVGHVYSYGSLLHYRLVQTARLPVRYGAAAIRALLSSLAILVLQHADDPSPDKFCELRPRGSGDVLAVEYALSALEQERNARAERAVVRAFRRLACVGLPRVSAGQAASAHYAGTFPMRPEGGELTTEPGGRLRGTRAVYVVDGSVFPRLPAKGLTFTMMANANRVGTELCRVLRA